MMADSSAGFRPIASVRIELSPREEPGVLGHWIVRRNLIGTSRQRLFDQPVQQLRKQYWLGRPLPEVIGERPRHRVDLVQPDLASLGIAEEVHPRRPRET